jgi:mannose-1-phosphate guanylyltransferase/mannose-6-phosphate isomerase
VERGHLPDAVSDLIAAFETHAPDWSPPAGAAIDTGAEDLGFFRLGAEAYGQAEAISFDYAIMEKADHGHGRAADQRLVGSGRLGCAVAGRGARRRRQRHVGAGHALDCRDSYLRSESDGIQLVGLGLEGMVAVAMPDAVLVADKSRAQDVKAVVDTLRAAKSPRPTIIRAFTGPGAGTRRCAWATGSR